MSLSASSAMRGKEGGAMLPPTLDAKITAFTVRPKGGAPGADEHVVVVEPTIDVTAGFARAQELLARGLSVRLVAQGAALPHAWPAWVHDADRLTLTEWGAFQFEDRVSATREVRDGILAWSSRVFDRPFGDAPGGRLMYAQAICRLFLRAFEVLPVARGLATAFPRARFECIAPDDMLDKLLRDLTAGARPARPHGRLRTLALGAGGIAASAAEQVKAYVDAAASRRRLADSAPRDSTPRVWVALMPDWHRINHQLVHSLAIPALEGNEELGVLLVGSLAPGARDESNLRNRKEAPLWAGLGPLLDELPRCTVAQAVFPERPARFAKALARSVVRASKAVVRMAKNPEAIGGGIHLDALGDARAAVSLATKDVFVATLAEEATKDLTGRLSFRGATVALCTASVPATTPVDHLLQQGGARTIDYPHGSASDMLVAGGWGWSSVTCGWTRVDARAIEAAELRPVVTGVPPARAIPPRDGPMRRVLVMTNYVHRDTRIGDRFPREPYQIELLDLVPRLRAFGHAELSFRWRPHPADNDDAIARALARHEGVELSRGVPLHDDLSWADVVVTSFSTTLVEALFASVPVFVHLTPELWDIVATSFIEKERRFFHAQEGAELVHRMLGASGDRLAAERRSLATLWGPEGKPTPMLEFVRGA